MSKLLKVLLVTLQIFRSRLRYESNIVLGCWDFVSKNATLQYKFESLQESKHQTTHLSVTFLLL